MDCTFHFRHLLSVCSSEGKFVFLIRPSFLCEHVWLRRPVILQRTYSCDVVASRIARASACWTRRPWTPSSLLFSPWSIWRQWSNGGSVCSLIYLVAARNGAPGAGWLRRNHRRLKRISFTGAAVSPPLLSTKSALSRTFLSLVRLLIGACVLPDSKNPVGNSFFFLPTPLPREVLPCSKHFYLSFILFGMYSKLHCSTFFTVN